ncbi:PulJ/GspJ family protein [Curtobacterium luteum]|uniref:Prepilin-type N-terminal cleavage/methylation domain-containing protein n=1 Tax=Curtobacterium luteum TaxID=33881 RepID=A0A175S004_9MICO|nr:prepilin-type N-terminal cleavage/methylation domain-containing protein [Curtobacterium luteum]KTR09015.1 hypothetical protein NS184_04195 [Curtobacterium luteum]
MRALLHRLRAEDRGITLVELIVAMLVTSLMLTLVGSFFVSMTKAQQTVSGLDASTRQGTTSVTQLGRYLREASRVPVSRTVTQPAFSTATAGALAFTSSVDTTTSAAGMTKVTVDVVAGKLLMQLQRGDCSTGYCTFPSSNPVRSVVLADVVRGRSLFTYSNANGTVFTPTSTTVDTIRSVRITLTTGSTGSAAANDTTFAATINLRNLDYGAATES